MIRIGKRCVFATPGRGIKFENSGRIVFKGECSIGSDSFISVGKHGFLVFGHGVTATTATTILCQHRIELGKDVLIGWNVLIYDNDFHQVQYDNPKNYKLPYGPVFVGEKVWICQGTTIAKNAKIPEECIVAANTYVSATIDCNAHTVIAGIPARPVKAGVWLDRTRDAIQFG